MNFSGSHSGAHPGRPVDVSVLIPTFNPEERIIRRLLDSIAVLECNDGIASECVIVDNNSEPPLEDRPFIQDFLGAVAWARIVKEPRPGLVFAKMAGIRSTAGSVVIFFDDDNVPAPDYLTNALALMAQNASVGVWGPGRISVEFVDPIPDWLRPRAATMHNERLHEFPAYGCVPARWFDFYPIGMGQVMRRAVAERYYNEVEAGRLRSTGRIGQSLASGEDIQVIWEATKMGLAAGVHPDLKVVHLIPAKRCTAKHLKRLAFGTAASYAPSLVDSFPAELENVRRGIPSRWRILSSILRRTIRHASRMKFRFLSIDLANDLGRVSGALRASGAASHHWVFGLAKKLGFE